jgi:hypothetical protein
LFSKCDIFGVWTHSLQRTNSWVKWMILFKNYDQFKTNVFWSEYTVRGIKNQQTKKFFFFILKVDIPNFPVMFLDLLCLALKRTIYNLMRTESSQITNELCLLLLWTQFPKTKQPKATV